MQLVFRNTDARRTQHMSKPIIISTTGNAIEEQALRKFEASLLGAVIHPSEERYERSRRVWNGMIDRRRTGMIVRCATTVDVARSVEFARSNELAVAVRAGGHSLTGDSFCDGGMVIDVSGMKSIEVDTEKGSARADVGLTVGEFDRATQAFGLATVLGECSSVGIAGYTLGGELGRLMGKHGAGCDNLLSAELIVADGKVFRASAEENADLFWAIRGGGGNFGIVTSLEYRLHRVGQILGGTLTYPISDTREVLTFLDDYMVSVPDELDIAIDIGNCGLMMSAPGIMEPIISLALSYCGDLEKGEAELKPLRTFRKPVADSIRVMPYIERQAQAIYGLWPSLERQEDRWPWNAGSSRDSVRRL
jgi:FAD binding domain